MRLTIDKPGVYELQLVHETKPPVVIPEPPPPVVVDPPVDPPTSKDAIYARLKELFTDPSQWSSPELVWEYPEPSGGVFVPMSRTEFLQQDRAGGKIRWFTDGIKTNVFVRDMRGVEVPAFIHDAKKHNGKIYGVFMLHEELWLGVCENPKDRKPLFFLDTPVRFEGAKDTNHALEVVSDTKFAIYGRLRHGNGVDWQESGEPLGARRGQRRVIVNNKEIVVNEVYFDPVIEQPGYEHNQFRYDYYATRLCHILGFDVQLISCYQKNSDRVPSTRPERTSGTGPIIPIVAIGREILSHTVSPFPLAFFARRTKWEEAHPYEPELGQLYGAGITFDISTGRIDAYARYRDDTHYLVKQGDKLPNAKVYRITANI